jgi:hypothetical protein
MNEQEPRAEEIIVEALRQKNEILHSGGVPRGVVLSRANYERIQRYHAGLGEVTGEVEDYIGKYRLFGMPIYIDNDYECTVLPE